MTRSPPRRSPVSTGFGTTVPSAATVITMCCDWSSMTAASGTSRAGAGGAIATRIRANSPGHQEEIRIGDRGAGMDRAARAVERIVDEVERALPGEAVLVAEADRDLDRRADPGDARVRARRSGSRIRSCRSRDRSDRARRASPAGSSGWWRHGCRRPGCRSRPDARRCGR